jgi:tetratricopeptide (TPR) repeat protein
MDELEPIQELSQRVEKMASEVDALQVAARKRDVPWYENVSSIIAVLALLFSFGTTYVSYRHTRLQDIQNHRIELRSLLQRLAALPKDNLEIMKRYSNDALSAGLISSYINWENILLTRQAAEIARYLPADQLSATEYQGIALAMYNSRDYQDASLLYQKAIETAESLDDEMASRRGKANLLFVTGKPEPGRAEFMQALSVFDRRHGYDNYTQVSTNLLTELTWAFAEANSSFFDQAKNHTLIAERLVNSLPQSPGQQQFRGQVLQAKLQFGIP